MDPNQTLQDLLLSLEIGDYTEAEDHAVDLLEWLQRGGFAPTMMFPIRIFPPLPADDPLTIAIEEINERVL